MATYLNREAEKSPSVRANRPVLEEITAYLGWHLQGRAEQRASNGRLSTVDLKTEIYRYLTQAQKDTTLVDALFTDATDRVWALASKAQGTFEFDVQPVREFFAAKYLNNYATVPKSDVLNALIRRPFWFNTSRFFAGFANPNEIGGLVDGLTDELAAARHPLAERIATWTMLADGVSPPKPQRKSARPSYSSTTSASASFMQRTSSPMRCRRYRPTAAHRYCASGSLTQPLPSPPPRCRESGCVSLRDSVWRHPLSASGGWSTHGRRSAVPTGWLGYASASPSPPGAWSHLRT
jgi:hypothetical protein